MQFEHLEQLKMRMIFNEQANGAARRSIPITEEMVWKAYKKVRSNKGAAGVDGTSLKEFEQELSSQLYKLWNRLCYFLQLISFMYLPSTLKNEKINEP